MRKQKDILSLSVFIFLLLAICLGLFFRFQQMISKTDYSKGIKTVYVDPDRIVIPISENNTVNNVSGETEIQISPINMPNGLSNYFYAYTPNVFPAEELMQSSANSFEELKNTLESNFTDSAESARQRNLEIADFQNYAKIREFENDARDMLQEKIKSNSSLKTQAFLDFITSEMHKNILNTEKNRKNASAKFAKYVHQRNAYMNDYYIFYLYTENFRQKEKNKTAKSVNSKFEEYEKKHRLEIDRQITYSENIVKDIIKNIKTDEAHRSFTYTKIDSFKGNNLGDSATFKKEVNTEKSLKKDKKKIITQIANDNLINVTFSKESSVKDGTEEIQKLIDKYGYLYSL